MDDTSGPRPTRDENGRFLPGNPGRPPGARNRMSQQVAQTLQQHFSENHKDILGRLSLYHIAEYVRLIGIMLPKGAGDDSACQDTAAEDMGPGGEAP